MDPRVTFAGVIVASTAAFVLGGWGMLPLMLLLLALCAWHAEDIRRYKRGVKGLMLMMLFIGFVQSIHPHGEGLISVPLPLIGDVGMFSPEGMDIAARIMARMSVLIMTTILFASTVDEGEFLRGLSSYRIPYPAVFSINLVLRLIPDLSEDLADIELAFRGRELGARRTYMGRWSNYLKMIKPLFVRHLKLAYMMGLSLELRGFSGKMEDKGGMRRLSLPEASILVLSVSAEVLLVAWAFIA